MKIGVEVSIDVMKVDKARLYAGKNGAKYLTMTTFINTGIKDKYNNNGFISEKQTEDERNNKVNTTILGNCKVFWSNDSDESYPEPVASTPDAIEEPPF